MVQDASMRAAAGRQPPTPGQTGLLQPDLTLLFFLDPAVAAQRLAGARAPDRFEQQPVDFFSAVVQGYAARAEAEPQRIGIVQADQPREDVWRAVLQHVKDRRLFARVAAQLSKE
jgi:dTMP kinase